MKALACVGMGRPENSVIEGFRSAGLEMDEIWVADLSENQLGGGDYLFVLTVNFSPEVSNVCQKALIPYLSYITSWPERNVYHPAIGNPCNFVFCFDGAVCQKLRAVIPDRIYHLPLGADLSVQPVDADSMDVSFVGSLYKEGSDAFDQAVKLSQYSQGYIEALLKVQVRIYGYNLLEAALNKNLVKELQSCLPYEALPGETEEMRKEVLAATYLSDKVTAMERYQLLRAVSGRFETQLYTGDAVDGLPQIHVRGQVETDEERAGIYRNSRINLHFTPRSVQTGIPQQVFDIMEAGGFVLTNFQMDIPDYFVIGEQLETFTSENELLEKIQYYLEHEEERARIALAGQQAVREYHSYKQRAVTIFNTVFSDVE